ncbi:MATE family efflux transporter [Paenibacillus pasadenensis]|uniref:MATE family efflux transporter n=1 Tax=Paenibacillus pasadenensis TaxID=217090 RepID=UPI00203A5DC3|nr:MATE family efflux transporter [Paenibacillus pasadenensis]MCM3748749.1 MATE family efflux transporter [Paenibacillus pasadenensis]
MIRHEPALRGKMLLFLSILGPIIITQMSYNAMGVIDTMMSGHAGKNDLAGVAVGSSLFMPLMTGMNSVLFAITPTIGQMIGRGEKDHISRPVVQALYLSFIISLLILIAGAFAVEPVLSLMGLDSEVHRIAKHFLIGLSIGIIPLFGSYVLRYFWEAQGYTRMTMFMMFAAIPLNIVLNYGLIFGKLGMPQLGGVGSGYATGLTYWFIFAVSVWLTFRTETLRVHRLFRRWYAPSWKSFKELLGIGIPMGLSTFFEASIFAAVTLFMGGMFGTTIIAAHQATVSFSSLLFMIPLSISMALTIIVSYEAGSGRFKHARAYANMGVSLAVGIMVTAAVALYFFRPSIAAMYTSDPEVAVLVVTFLIFALLFQLSDASQAALQGVLRGYKDVKVPFIVAFVSYWIIGMPLGYAFAAWTDLGPYGFWVGITAGLTFATVGFGIRLRIVQKAIRIRESGAVDSGS